jgi:type IV pilus assembly protein PilM
MVALGNAMKMPGLRRYLSQSLGIEVIRLDAFERLKGPEVVGAPAFKENLLCFGVAYGLAVQALQAGRQTLKTNLLPPEIIKDRFIRGKKPWALAAAALLLLGCAIGYASSSWALGTVRESKFKSAESRMSNVISDSSRLKTDEQQAKDEFNTTSETAKHLVGNVDNRVLWLELLRAVSECLPKPDPPEKRPKDIHERKELHIQSLECQKVKNLATWYEGVKDKPPLNKTAPAADSTDTSGSMEQPGMDGQTADTGPTGSGWVVQLTGYHYHNPPPRKEGDFIQDDKKSHAAGGQYILETLIAGLEGNAIPLPSIEKKPRTGEEPKDDEQVYVSMKELGIGYPVLVYHSKPFEKPIIDPETEQKNANGTPDPGAAGDTAHGGRLAAPEEEKAKTILARRVDFVVQFCWQPKSPTERLEDKKKKQQQQADPLGQIDE